MQEEIPCLHSIEESSNPLLNSYIFVNPNETVQIIPKNEKVEMIKDKQISKLQFDFNDCITSKTLFQFFGYHQNFHLILIAFYSDRKTQRTLRLVCKEFNEIISTLFAKSCKKFMILDDHIIKNAQDVNAYNKNYYRSFLEKIGISTKNPLLGVCTATSYLATILTLYTTAGACLFWTGLKGLCFAIPSSISGIKFLEMCGRNLLPASEKVNGRCSKRERDDKDWILMEMIKSLNMGRVYGIGLKLEVDERDDDDDYVIIRVQECDMEDYVSSISDYEIKQNYF